MRMLRIVSLFVFVLVTVGAPDAFAQKVSKAQAYYDEAMEFLAMQEEPFSRENIMKAVILYENAIAADKNFTLAYEQLASEYWSLGDQDKGMAIIDAGIENNKEAASLYLMKGMLLEDKQQFDEAKALYKKAQELYIKQYKPKKRMSFEEVFNFALTYYLLENQEAAINKFTALAKNGAFSDDDYEWFFPLGIDTLSDFDIADYVAQSVTNKYGFKEEM